MFVADNDRGCPSTWEELRRHNPRRRPTPSWGIQQSRLDQLTQQNHRQAIKRFWRWLGKCPEGKDPPETDWFKAGKGRKILPEELLAREESQKIIEAAEHP